MLSPTNADHEDMKIKLPRQLDSVKKTNQFPSENHQWNTNEEVAAVLIAFEFHEKWQSTDVKLRPQSGSMLLYNRKKARYRRDDYCWKKRKDGKTTREDHMKLKVNGAECIYGCYVHSAILPTFHRRCYWLLQNPDLVMVHYLNVPLRDDGKHTIPSLPLGTLEPGRWTREELMNEIRPMFARKEESTSQCSTSQKTEDAIEKIVDRLMEQSTTLVHKSDCGCKQPCLGKCKKQQRRLSPRRDTPKPIAVQGPTLKAGARAQAANSTPNKELISTDDISSRQAGTHAPLILNLAQLQGSNGLVILSSQMAVNNMVEKSGVGITPASLPDCRASNTQNVGPRPKHQASVVLSSNAPVGGLNTHGGATHSVTTLRNITPSQKESKGQECSKELFKVEDENLEFDLVNVPNKSTQQSSLDNHDSMYSGVSQPNSNTPVNEAECNLSLAQSLIDGSDFNNVSAHNSQNVDDLVEDLNLRNELNNLAQNLTLSHDDIQKALGDGIADDGCATVTVAPTHHSTASLSTLPSLATSIAPQTTDLNFDDAFDILLDFADMDNVSVGNNLLPATLPLPPDSTSVKTTSNIPVTHTTNSIALTTAHSSSNFTTCLSSQQVGISRNNLTGIANITDFSPEWSYTEGGCKVLVAGPWYSTTSPYTVLFDGVCVPSTLVQSGVLRCHTPVHIAGLVTLQVACEGFIISNSCVFEYKCHDHSTNEDHPAKPSLAWFKKGDAHLIKALIDRLILLEKNSKNTTISLLSQIDLSHEHELERQLVVYCEQLKKHALNEDIKLLPPQTDGLSLLHIVASLGFQDLAITLIKWRSETDCDILDKEVDALSIDNMACTPLMWSCALGRRQLAELLFLWNRNAINVCSKVALLPLEVAEANGHQFLASSLRQLQNLQLPHSAMHHQPLGHVDKKKQSSSAAATMRNRQEQVSVKDNDGFITPAPYVKPNRSELRENLPPTTTCFLSPMAAQHLENWSASMRDLKIEIPPPPSYPIDKDVLGYESLSSSLQYKSVSREKFERSEAARRSRLMKRTSVEVLPDYPAFAFPDLTKCSKTDNILPHEDRRSVLANGQSLHSVTVVQGLKASNSDPHLAAPSHQSAYTPDPMISVSNRDLNSPLFMLTDQVEDFAVSEIQADNIAMETDSPEEASPLISIDGLSASDEEIKDSTDSSQPPQMMALASQIIAAMPERIKLSPSRIMDEIPDEYRIVRDRSSSYSSGFSSGSSVATPPRHDDSGISTPLEGMAFDEYRYNGDLGTPTSSLSPASSCLHSPYNFNLSSPPPTAADFTEYFNAPATYMEKDFSQLTLTDEEQRRLYEAAKIIQNFYRKYKDKKEHNRQRQQQQTEIEAAILIQSYYRRYKQYMYYKKMTQAAVLIQSQFRSYYAQKRFRQSREAATIIQNRYRAYKEHERFKKSRNAAVLIQQRFRNHYQRKRSQQSVASKVQEMVEEGKISTEQSGRVQVDLAAKASTSSTQENRAVEMTKHHILKRLEHDEAISTLDAGSPAASNVSLTDPQSGGSRRGSLGQS